MSCSELRPSQIFSVSQLGGRSRSPLLRNQPGASASAVGQSRNSFQGKGCATVQKLSTDKKQLRDHYRKVQHFLIFANFFDRTFVDPNSIKPPSIDDFINISNMLLLEILPNVKIDKYNYIETIPAQLKVLRYPDTVSKSFLRTANIMPSWPKVIYMWSWLIDKVNLSKDAAAAVDLDRLERKELIKFRMRQHVQDFILMRFNMRDHQNKTGKINDAYVKKRAELLVDSEKHKRMQKDVAEMKNYRNNLQQDIRILKATNVKMESKLEEMRESIMNFKENDIIESNVLENELKRLRSSLIKQTSLIKCIKRHNAQLTNK